MICMWRSEQGICVYVGNMCVSVHVCVYVAVGTRAVRITEQMVRRHITRLICIPPLSKRESKWIFFLFWCLWTYLFIKLFTRYRTDTQLPLGPGRPLVLGSRRLRAPALLGQGGPFFRSPCWDVSCPEKFLVRIERGTIFPDNRGQQRRWCDWCSRTWLPDIQVSEDGRCCSPADWFPPVICQVDLCSGLMYMV